MTGTLSAFVASIRPAVAAEIARVYDDPDMFRPDPGDVIADALAAARDDIRDRADDQARCTHLDDCTTKALVLQALADWMEGQP